MCTLLQVKNTKQQKTNVRHVNKNKEWINKKIFLIQTKQIKKMVDINL